MGGNLVNLLVFALVIGAPALSWIVGKMKEAAEMKRLRDVSRRRMDEQLRTGRAAEDADPEAAPTPTAQPAKPARTASDLQALAQRRQAQLRALRQRQAGAPAPAAPPTVRARPVPTQAAPTSPAGSGHTVPVRPITMARPVPSARTQTPQRTVTSARPTARRVPAQQQPVDPRDAQQEALKAQYLKHRMTHRAADATAAAAAAATAVSKRMAIPGRAELRRAIILNELLSPPVALRDE